MSNAGGGLPRLLVGVPVHSTVAAALRASGSSAQSRPVDTRQLLTNLMHADESGRWQRFRLQAGDAEAVADRNAHDAAAAAAATWEGIAVTYACARALDMAAHLSRRYNIWPLSVGMTAIALIAEPSAGAARALGDGLDHQTALDVLQSDVLGVRLDDLDRALATVVQETSQHHRPGSGRHTASAASPRPASRYRRLAKWKQVVLPAVLVAIPVSFVLWALITAPPGLQKAKVGDCLAHSPGTDPYVVSCSDKEAGYKVTAVLPAGRSADCPGATSSLFPTLTWYFDDGSRTVCVDPH